MNSHSFLSEFLRLGNLERKKKLLHQQEVTRKLEEKKEKYSVQREKSLEKLSLYSLAESYSEEEAKSAYEKFALMSLTHDPRNPTPLLGFVNGGEMTPKEFKEQLKRSFHLQLSSGEIASLVHHFDSNQNGLIDCHEFIRAFYQISFQERIQHHAKHHRIHNLLTLQRQRHQQEVSQKFLSRAEVKLRSPTEKSRHTTRQKLQLMALQYDSKQSSVQWGNMLKVFESSKITLKHFHEIMKRQFCISFTSSELGVIYEMFHAPASSRPSSSHQRGQPREGTKEGNEIAEEVEDIFPSHEHEEEEEEEHSPHTSTNHLLTDGNCLIYCQKFLSYFFQLSKVEKQKFTDHHLWLNRKIQKKKESYEKNLVKKLVRQKETTVTYPELPNVNLSMDTSTSQLPLFNSTVSSSSPQPNSLDNSMSFLEDPSGDALGNRPATSFSRRSTRKLSVLDTIAPNRHVLKLFKQEKSLVNLYPLASEETKVPPLVSCTLSYLLRTLFERSRSKKKK